MKLRHFLLSLARLVDIAPAEIVVYSEASDWALLGGDFKDAIDEVAQDLVAEPLTQQLPHRL